MDAASGYREERVQIPAPGGHTLAATLILPGGTGPHPALLFCHFADTHLRDAYRLYAPCFVERGLAALIYDKRGRGESTGEPLFSEIGPLADDAASVYRFLQSHPAIDAGRVGFWGASNGGWVAPLAASRVSNPAFVIAVSAAGVTPAEQERVRRVNIVRDLGASPEAVDLISRMWLLLYDFRVHGRWTSETGSILRQVYDHEELQDLPKQAEYGPGLQAVPPRVPIDELKATAGGSWAEGGFDPAPVYASLRCPLLFVWGNADIVLPVDESQSRLVAALERAGHTDFEVIRLPGASHKLSLVPPGISSHAYHRSETPGSGDTVIPGIRERMAEWAAARVAQKASKEQ